MNFRDRLKMYALGFIAGCFLVVLFFGRRNSCKNYLSHYLPEGRVIQEIKAKPISYSADAMKQLQDLNIDTADFRNIIISGSDVDFGNSEPRAKPCGKFITHYKDSLQNLKINLLKCRDHSEILSVITQ